MRLCHNKYPKLVIILELSFRTKKRPSYFKLAIKTGKKSMFTNVTGGRIRFIMNQLEPGNTTVLIKQRRTSLKDVENRKGI